ncbi:aminotransferase-like domain-containing protein [Streptomyces sp. NPDC004752]
MPLLLGEWRNGAGSLAERLAHAIEQAIERGELLEGWLLPSERKLAAVLDISRSTTVRGMELLAERSVVRRVHGAGTYVAGPAKAPNRTAMPPGLRGKFRLGTSTEPGIAYATPPSPKSLPTEALTLTADELLDLHPSGAGSGYAIAGLDITRTAISDSLSRHGLPTMAEALVVTTGATQSLSLVFEMLLVPGDVVIVDSPAYPTTLDLLRRMGVRIVPVRTGDAAVGTDAVVRVARKTQAKMVVAMATCNVATGYSMTDTQRAALVQIAQSGVLVVDDRTLADYHPAPEPTALAALRDHKNIITVGSFNKIYWGGLRMGWVRVQRNLVEALIRVKAGADSGSSVPSQMMLAKLLPHHDAIVAHRQAEVERRTLIASAFIRNELPDWRIEGTGIGPSQWIRLPVRDTAEFVAFAYERGTAVGYGGMYRSDGRPSAHLRVTLTSDEHHITTALENLRDAWSDFPAGRGRRRR